MECSYYDGRSPIPRHVRVTVEPSGLTLKVPGGTTRFWGYQELRQTQGRYSGEEVRLERGSGIDETLVVPNPGILLAIHQEGGTRTSHLHHPGTRGRRVFLTILAALACVPVIYAIFSWGIPGLAGPITKAIPISWEIRLGEFVIQEFTKNHAACDDPELTANIETIMMSLTNPLTQSPYSFRVTVVDSPMVNALAAPGGNIIVFRGLLEDTDRPEELAGVLAHEIQHVRLRHGMRLIVQHMSMAVIIAALSGDTSGMLSYGLQAAQTLQSLSYGREAEHQADEEGLSLLLQAHIDPNGMMTFFSKLSQAQRDNSPLRYLSTHPSTEERIRHLENLLPAQIPQIQPFPFAKNWEHIRSLCGNTTPSTR
ncbi:MAG: M48 family metallopeptidase [Nitrospirales bacterium]|nr:M48 family metallopeptidase [Nitrospirales bacterium]